MAETILGDLGTFRNGVNFSKAQMGSGLKLINVKDIFGDSPWIDFDALDLVNLDAGDKVTAHTVTQNDLFFVRSSVKRSGIGLVRLAKRTRPDAIHCGFVIRLRLNGSDPDALFLTYLLRSPGERQKIMNLSGGSAIINISQSALASLRVVLPSLPTQRKIAAILLAYDDTIEINLRRIRILEEMAQALYREWFVEFRFPGYKRIRFIDSSLGRIPEGWEVKSLGDHLIALESGRRPKGGVRGMVDGIPSIGAENIEGIGRHNFAAEKFVSPEFFGTMKSGVVRDRDVAIYKDGAYIGKSSFFRDGFPHSECCVNEHVFLLRTNGHTLTQNNLYLWLRQADTVAAIRATNANAAQPGINQQSVRSLVILTPGQGVAKEFDVLVEPLLGQIVGLAKKNTNLRRTRDLLLPRLISGELDVSNLDIAVQEAVA